MNYKQGELFPSIKPPTDEYLIVSALASELPEALPQNLLFTGVGKVNATHILTRYLVKIKILNAFMIYLLQIKINLF